MQQEASASQGGRSAATIGGAAGLGAVISALAGGGTEQPSVRDLARLPAHSLAVVLSEPRVRIPAETRLQFTLLQPIHQPSGRAQ